MTARIPDPRPAGADRRTDPVDDTRATAPGRDAAGPDDGPFRRDGGSSGRDGDAPGRDDGASGPVRVPPARPSDDLFRAPPEVRAEERPRPPADDSETAMVRHRSPFDPGPDAGRAERSHPH